MFQVYLSICDNTHSVETGICYLLHFPSYGPLCCLRSPFYLYVCIDEFMLFSDYWNSRMEKTA